MDTDLAMRPRGSGSDPEDEATVADAKAAGVVPCAVLLLAGATRKLGLADEVGRSPLELPVSNEQRLLDVWVQRLGELAAWLGVTPLSVRVLVNDRVPSPEGRVDDGRVSLKIERDELELRGTAGLLRDACAGYGDDDWVLVANAGQLLMGSLDGAVGALMSVDGAVRVLKHADGTPSSFFLMRCGVLKGVSRQGYIDLKEQFLPKLAETERVMTVDHPALAVPVRTVNDYVEGLREYHRAQSGGELGEPYAEDWRSTFSVVEPGAEVGAGVRLHDSVVLAGGRVGAKAILVRSVVCAAGMVPQGRMRVDSVIGTRRSSTARTGGRPHGLE